jgi:hypothetical protein
VGVVNKCSDRRRERVKALEKGKEARFDQHARRSGHRTIVNVPVHCCGNREVVRCKTTVLMLHDTSQSEFIQIAPTGLETFLPLML